MGYITKIASGAVISLFPEAVSYATAPIRFLISSGDALLLISRVIPLILRVAPELFSELPSVLIDCCFVGAITDVECQVKLPISSCLNYIFILQAGCRMKKKVLIFYNAFPKSFF